MANKKRILWVGDYNHPSGFAEVSTNILHRLDESKYDIHVLACNYDGFLPVFPAKFPVYGCHSPYAVNEIAKVFDLVKPDILMTLNDGYVIPNYVAALGKKRLNECHWVSYIVFDGLPINMNWARMLKHMDTVVFPTPWQKEEMEKVLDKECYVIWHGVDTKKYYPLDKETVENYKILSFGEKNKDAFIFGMVGKNFQRKRFPELIEAFAMFKHKMNLKFEREPILVLYTSDDARGEINLLNVMGRVGCQKGDMAVIIPPNNAGISDQDMNMLYNSFDVNCLISIGEGYGLPTNNAAACGKMTIALDNSVQKTLGCILPMMVVEPSKTPTFFPNDMEQYRYLPNVETLAKAMAMAYQKVTTDKEFMQKIKGVSEAAIKELNWDKIILQWESLLDNVGNTSKRLTVI